MNVFSIFVVEQSLNTRCIDRDVTKGGIAMSLKKDSPDVLPEILSGQFEHAVLREPQLPSRRVRFLGDNIILLLALVACIVGFGLARPSSFLSLQNAYSMLTEASTLAILAVGLTIVLVVGDIDLSFASIASLAGAASASLMSQNHLDWYFAVIIALAIGLVAGVLNAVLVAGIGLPSFVTTLATSTALVGSSRKRNRPPRATAFAKRTILLPALESSFVFFSGSRALSRDSRSSLATATVLGRSSNPNRFFR